MENYFLLQTATYSILISAVIGAVRFKKILKSYRPFVFLIWAGSINEIISEFTADLLKDSTVNNNIYTLVDFSIIIMLFLAWDETGNKKKLYAFWIFGALVWITDNLVLHSLHTVSSYFRIVYGLIVVFLSIEGLNQVLFTERRQTYKNAKLIICIGFIILYTYKAVLEVFIVVPLQFSRDFYIRLFLILIYVNLLTNLLFAFAMLCLPTKRQFTLPY